MNISSEHIIEAMLTNSYVIKQEGISNWAWRFDEEDGNYPRYILASCSKPVWNKAILYIDDIPIISCINEHGYNIKILIEDPKKVLDKALNKLDAFYFFQIYDKSEKENWEETYKRLSLVDFLLKSELVLEYKQKKGDDGYTNMVLREQDPNNLVTTTRALAEEWADIFLLGETGAFPDFYFRYLIN